MVARELFNRCVKGLQEAVMTSGTQPTHQPRSTRRSTAAGTNSAEDGWGDNPAVKAAIAAEGQSSTRPQEEQSATDQDSSSAQNQIKKPTDATKLAHVADQNNRLRASLKLEERKVATAEAELDKLNDTLRDQSARSNILGHRLQDARHQIQNQQADIITLSHANHGLQVSVHNCTYQNTLLQHDYQKEKRNADELAEENKTLRLNLEDCKEQIFKMQPFECLSDTQLVRAHNNLCESIESWMVTTFNDVENGLMRLLEEYSTDSGGQFVRTYLSMEEIALVNEHSAIDLNLLALSMLRHLHELCLNPERVHPGATRETEILVSRMLRGIQEIDPPRDERYIQMWRVDLHRSLNAIRSDTEVKDGATGKWVDQILECFWRLLPKPDQKYQIHEVDAVVQIVQDACELAKNIQLSAAVYEWRDSPKIHSQLQGMAMRHAELKDFNIIDANTGQLMRSQNIKPLAADTVIGQKLCTSRPGMVKKGVKGAGDVQLSKATIIVAFDPEVRQKKARKLVSAKDEGNSTGASTDRQPGEGPDECQATLSLI